MGKPDDFDLIDEREVEKESRSLLWLAVVIVVIGFALAVGVALLTLSSRLKGAPAAPVAQITLTATMTPAPAGLPAEPTPKLTNSAPATPTPSATHLPTPTPPCVYELDAAFGQTTADRARGCPQSAPGRIVWAAWEPFERGAMLWRSDTDLAYIFTDSGRWSAVDERWSGEPQPSRGEPPLGLVAPVRGFGYVWGASENIYNRLGWATDVEKGFCARVQEFDHEFILQSEALPSCTAENLFNHATTADWRQFRLHAHDDGSWR